MIPGLNASYFDLLRWLAPEAILTIVAAVGLLIDLGLMRGESRRHRSWIACGVTSLGCLITLLWLANVPTQARLGDGILAVDALTQWVKLALVGLLLLTALISADADFTPHVGEYYALLLLATVGMMFMVSSEETLSLFVSLELTSLCLYVLAGFNLTRRASAEAALKYFFFGAMASAFLLFGLSLLYGLAGSTGLRETAAALARDGLTPLAGVATVMVLIGLGFKVAIVPFHLWAPDAYEGAPPPAAALIASGSKVASFFLLARFLSVGLSSVAGNAAPDQWRMGWMPLIAVLGVASMLVGNLAALAQKHVGRLLAYSAVAHAGYLSVGLIAIGLTGVQALSMAALVYYLVTYGLTLVGMFGLLAVLERHGHSGQLSDFVGLSRRAPGLALCLMAFLLSLAGLPPLAGFFAKFSVFAAALSAQGPGSGLLWLVACAIAFSVVSLYYYFQILKQAYVTEPRDGPSCPPLPLTPIERLVLPGMALGVLGLGMFPDLLLRPIHHALRLAGY